MKYLERTINSSVAETKSLGLHWRAFSKVQAVNVGNGSEADIRCVRTEHQLWADGSRLLLDSECLLPVSTCRSLALIDLPFTSQMKMTIRFLLYEEP